jgi:hypothetical protein
MVSLPVKRKKEMRYKDRVRDTARCMSLFVQYAGRNAQCFAQFACKAFGEKSKNHSMISMRIAQRYARPYSRVNKLNFGTHRENLESAPLLSKLTCRSISLVCIQSCQSLRLCERSALRLAM